MQSLDMTSFPRLGPATVAGLHTGFAVAVPGGVAEFLSKQVLSEDFKEHLCSRIAEVFGSCLFGAQQDTF